MDAPVTRNESRDVYNLVLNQNDFFICAYQFSKRHNYNDIIQYLPQQGQVQYAFTAPDGDRHWRESQSPDQGINVPTFKACWAGTGEEPAAFILDDAPLIADIVHLSTFWGDRFVFSRQDERDAADSPYYWPDWYILHPYKRMMAIDRVLGRAIQDGGLPDFPIKMVTSLLIEADRSNMMQTKGLLMSPCLDLVAASTPSKFKGAWSPEEQSEIGDIRDRILEVLQSARQPRVISDAMQPFASDVGRLGSPRAADNLAAYLRWSLEWLGLPDEVVVSHSKTINKVRNAIIHSASPPDRRLEVLFLERDPVVIPRDASPDDLLRAALYVGQVCHSIVKVHVSLVLGLPLELLRRPMEEIEKFFRFGIYNDFDVFRHWFDEMIISH